uniref:Retrovirus-related Pol polyprotein from transposon TNT 1-94 n=1 Tax=Rhizophora mucronata TaxID=61149 RepID=A0A2P2J5R1_RHIMU
MSSLGKSQWQAVKWILRYLQGILDAYLEFGKNLDSLVGFIDFDYVANLDKRRFLIGYVFCISGFVVSCKATLQHVVVLSITKTKCMTMTEAIKEALWLKTLYGKLSLRQDVVTIYYDN